jgi:hypothetical protein
MPVAATSLSVDESTSAAEAKLSRANASPYQIAR